MAFGGHRLPTLEDLETARPAELRRSVIATGGVGAEQRTQKGEEILNDIPGGGPTGEKSGHRSNPLSDHIAMHNMAAHATFRQWILYLVYQIRA
jgi:hypothetical protein